MQLLKFVPIKLTLFLVLGIIIGNYLNTTITIPLSLTITALIFLGIFFRIEDSKRSIYFGIATFLLTFSIGFLVISYAHPNHKTNYYGHYTSEKPQALYLKITEVLKPTHFSERYMASIFRVHDTETSGKILLTTALDTAISIKTDDELIVFSTLSNIYPPLNSHEFDYKKYLESLGVYHQLNIPAKNFIFIKNPGKTIYGRAANWRAAIISHLKKEDFGKDEIAIIQALILGERNDINEEIYTNYKNAGAIHILALSGLHIGIILLLLQFLLQPIEMLPFGKNIKLGLIIGILWAFAFLAGLSASIVRAVTMFSFLSYAAYLNRPTNRFNILALSLFFILVCKPTYLFQVGFQLSYAAVFAILWFYPLLQRFWFPKPIFVRKVWQLLSVSIAAQLGVLPLSLFYFHQFPGLFFISNLVIVPFLGVLLGAGILVIFLSLLEILPHFITLFYTKVIRLMNTIIEWIAQQEAFIFKDIPFDSLQLILAYLLLIFLIFGCEKVTIKKVAVFLFTLLAFQLWFLYSSYLTSKKEQLIVLHQSKNSGLLYKKGTVIHLLSNQPERFEKLITSYKVEERTTSLLQDSLKNRYRVGSEHLFIIDSFAIIPLEKTKVTYLLLTQTPEINLERVLDVLQPKFLIADGSNYKSAVRYWKETCRKRKLPFHYTGEKGAYYFTLKEEE